MWLLGYEFPVSGLSSLIAGFERRSVFTELRRAYISKWIALGNWLRSRLALNLAHVGWRHALSLHGDWHTLLLPIHVLHRHRKVHLLVWELRLLPRSLERWLLTRLEWHWSFLLHLAN